MKTVTFGDKEIHWAELGPDASCWYNYFENGISPSDLQAQNAINGYHRDWEYSCKRFGEVIKPGDLVVDIGAYAGDYTMPFGLLAGPTGLVIAFEPHPVTFPVLVKNAELNSHLCKFECHNVAIMGQDTDYTFHYGDNKWFNGGFASGLEVPIGQQKIAHVVPMKVKGATLQQFLPTDRKINFLKIDTEGWDHQVMKVLKDIILRDRPIIMSEVFTDLTMNERVDYYHVVKELGYTVKGNKPDIDDFIAHVAYDLQLFPA